MFSVLPTFELRLPRLLAALLVGGCLLLAGGCTGLRLPQVDPTGQCIFAPLPATTQLTLPCTGIGGHGCRCSGCLTGGCGLFPEPAFPQPTPPPPCEAPAAATAGPACGPKICLPAPGCEECACGPPAVLLGDQCRMRDLLHLPEKGKRGCILLSPQRIVAPVGGEVILLSGVCGDEGYLMTGEPLEWMLTPESVGHFIQVGDERQGLMHRLVGTDRADKRSGSFARGVTSTQRMWITRGNKNLRDDVPLEKGQTWISVSSPTEGTSRVTVLAPESDCWDQRKATATIYWIDARWQFPAPQVVPAGTPVVLTTRVTRSEGMIPAKGWIVRYEILNPDLASFAPGGTAVTEAVVDESGNATAQLIPLPGTRGTATVAATVIRPAGESDNMPRMTLGRGQALVTWTAPALELRAGAPQIATFDQPFQVAANVRNPGDLAAENVRVTVELPPGVTATATDSFASVVGNQIIWDIGSIPAKNQLDIFATLTARAPFLLRFQARAEGGLFAEDEVQIDVFQPSLSLAIEAVVGQPGRVEVGQPVTFNIDVTNIGAQPLADVRLHSAGDSAMMHESGAREVYKVKEDGPLQPGQTWSVASTFIPTTAGQRCVTVTATAAGGQQAQGQSCVTAINPAPPTPAVTARIEGHPQVTVGDQPLFRYRIANTGREVLHDVRVTVTFDPQLELLTATQAGVDWSGLPRQQLNWRIPELRPGDAGQATMEAQFRLLAPNARSLMLLSVETAEGARANDQFPFAILPNPVPPVTAPAPQPTMPPVQQPPSIPQQQPPAGDRPLEAPPLGAPQSPSDQQPAPQQPPASVQPPIPAAGALRLRLQDFDDPAEVGQPIRYTLTVTNDRPVPDSEVQLRFELPAGVDIERVTQTTRPGSAFQSVEGMIYLDELRQMTAGESVEYQLELRSNQPQTLALTIEARSRLAPGGVAVTEQTRVLPRP